MALCCDALHLHETQSDASVSSTGVPARGKSTKGGQSRWQRTATHLPLIDQQLEKRALIAARHYAGAALAPLEQWPQEELLVEVAVDDHPTCKVIRWARLALAACARDIELEGKHVRGPAVDAHPFLAAAEKSSSTTPSSSGSSASSAELA